MELNMMFSTIGILGGIICAVGDLLLDLKGKDNRKVGKSLVIESNWAKMSNWRFKLSIVLGFLGSLMYGIGIYSLARQLFLINNTLAEILVIISIVVSMSGFFIHSFICIAPIIYKAVLTGKQEDIAEYTINQLLSAIKIIFIILYSVVIFVPTIIVIVSICNGYFDVPMWCVLLNPVVFMIVGLILRLIKRDWFYELPSICMPSLGLGMFGVIGILNIL